jgi:hypothetical protein
VGHTEITALWRGFRCGGDDDLLLRDHPGDLDLPLAASGQEDRAKEYD